MAQDESRADATSGEASEPAEPPLVPAPSGGRDSAGAVPSFRGALGDPQALVDAAGPAIAFVVANRLVDVPTAGTISLALAALLCATRLLRRQPLRYALGGLAGALIAVGAAVVTGQAAAYFAPAAALNGLYAVVAVVSILARRPLVAWATAAAQRRPPDWFWQPHVRPAYSEITWAWAALFVTRASVRFALIASGRLEALAVAHVTLGLPAFAVLIVATYAYLRWRLPRLRRAQTSDHARDRA